MCLSENNPQKVTRNKKPVMTKNSIIQKITIVFLLVLSLKGFSQTTVVLNPVSDATVKSTGASDVQNVLRLQRWGSGTQWNPYGFKHF